MITHLLLLLLIIVVLDRKVKITIEKCYRNARMSQSRSNRGGGPVRSRTDPSMGMG
jgi:hypothetical protein